MEGGMALGVFLLFVCLDTKTKLCLRVSRPLLNYHCFVFSVILPLGPAPIGMVHSGLHALTLIQKGYGKTTIMQLW